MLRDLRVALGEVVGTSLENVDGLRHTLQIGTAAFRDSALLAETGKESPLSYNGRGGRVSFTPSRTENSATVPSESSPNR